MSNLVRLHVILQRATSAKSSPSNTPVNTDLRCQLRAMRHAETAFYLIGLSGPSHKCLIERSRTDVVEVVADGLQGDAQQKLHHLLLLVASRNERLKSFIFDIAAFSDDFRDQGHQSIELCVWNGLTIENCRYYLRRRIKKALSDSGMRCGAVAAVVLDACGQQDDLPFLWSE
jgi:hypothetical protein